LLSQWINRTAPFYRSTTVVWRTESQNGRINIGTRDEKIRAQQSKKWKKMQKCVFRSSFHIAREIPFIWVISLISGVRYNAYKAYNWYKKRRECI
jgi:hypothetical protein